MRSPIFLLSSSLLGYRNQQVHQVLNYASRLFGCKYTFYLVKNNNKQMYKELCDLLNDKSGNIVVICGIELVDTETVIMLEELSE